MEEMIVSYVYKSLQRKPTMSSMPTKWLAANVASWLGISIFLAVIVTPYAAIAGIFGFLTTTVFLQKAFLKDDNLFGVYWRHFWQKDSYPELSRFNYEEPAKKAK